MKKFIGILALFATALAAPAASKKKAADAKPAGPTAQVLTIPKDATPLPDGTYSYTDKDGKKWLYAKTPFGIMRSAADGSADPASSAASATTLEFTKATDKGDTVKFERATPFGPVVWERKKTDLTVEEKSILDHQTVKPQ
jgi:hypothetical protein